MGHAAARAAPRRPIRRSSGSTTACSPPMSRRAARWRRSGTALADARRPARRHHPICNRCRIAQGGTSDRKEHRMTDAGMIDLLVIGGGINGAGIARDAAGRGLSVVLCEKDDLAEGTLVALGQAGPWRPALPRILRVPAGPRGADRARGADERGAPHIIWPMRFVLPHSARRTGPAWLVRLGLFLYDHLGGRKKLPGTRTLDLQRDPEGAPILDKYTRGFEYSDCWVDDARLVVLNALDAAERGATILTRTPCISRPPRGRRLDASTHDEHDHRRDPRVRREGCWSTPPAPGSPTSSARVAGSNSQPQRAAGQGQPHHRAEVLGGPRTPTWCRTTTSG